MPVQATGSGGDAPPRPHSSGPWILLGGLLLAACAPETVLPETVATPAHGRPAAAVADRRDGSHRPGRGSGAPEEAPPVEPTQWALARAALEEGEPLAAMSLVLGTPVSVSEDATATDEALARPESTPRAGPSTPSLPPLSGEGLDNVLDRMPPAAQQLYAAALDDAGRPVGAAQAWERLTTTLPALADRFWMEAGNAHFKAGDDEQALQAYTNARDLLSREADRSADQRSLAELRRGNALLRLARLSEALAAYQAAAAADASEPARAQALSGVIAVHLAAGRDREAAAARLKLVRELPGSSLAPVALSRLKASGTAVDLLDEARVLAAQGDPAAAATLAPDRLPDAVDWLLAAGEADGALALAESAPAELEVDQRSEVDRRRARVLEQLGRDGEAAEVYEAMALEQPAATADASAWWSAARLRESAGDLSGAAADYGRIAAMAPAADDVDTSVSGSVLGAGIRRDDAAFRAGLMRWRLGARGAARQAWEEGLVLAADHQQRARLAYWAGRAAQAEGDDRAAEAHFGAAEAAAPLTVHGLLARSILRGGSVQNVDPLSAAIGSGMLIGGDPAVLDDSDTGPALTEGLERAEAWLSLGDPQAAEQSLVPRLSRSSAVGDSASLASLAAAADRLGLNTIAIRAATLALDQAGVADLDGASASLLALAYPTALHGEAIRQAAAEAGVPAHLLFALVRQESKFKPAAVSNLGAIGLTQMMPDTGKLVAGWLGDADFQPDDLRDPVIALRYGAHYLAWLLERYDGRVWPALAAYNAGPGPVDGWLVAAGGDMDSFLELIDYPETATYLRGVAAGSAAYRWRWPDLR